LIALLMVTPFVAAPHGEFEFTGTARSEKSRHREDWEKALGRAKSRTSPGRRPRIYSTDF
jgi:hypothetical protein